MTGKEETGIFTLYSDVEATAVRWLWYPFIAVGKITLLQGDPGDGKSTMMMNLIAELSKGGTMPDGKQVGIPQKIIYQCSEDDASDTIKPRLETCGTDCRNVAFINEEMNSGLTLDDERIRKAIIQFRPKLMVIDPIQAYLGSDSDLQIAGRARKLMQRLGMWASADDCAVVLIGHLNKKEGTEDLYRSIGSVDVVAAARSVLQMEHAPENKDIRIVRQIKNNLAPSDGEIRFSITAEEGFRWLECKIPTDPEAESEPPKFESKSEKAADLIKKLLSDGDMRSREIYMRMSDEGISRRTAENTKRVRYPKLSEDGPVVLEHKARKNERKYMGSSGVEAVDRKQKIRDRYKGVDASELEVIPAKAVEGFGESTSVRRVAAYVRVSTDNDEQTSSYELQKNYYTEYIKAQPDGNLSASMTMRASVALHWSIAKECSS